MLNRQQSGRMFASQRMGPITPTRIASQTNIPLRLLNLNKSRRKSFRAGLVPDGMEAVNHKTALIKKEDC